MSKHYCQAEVRKIGQKFWGNPSERPLAEPMPPELLERHPDTLTDWDNCEHCKTPMCGKSAHYRLWSDHGDPDVWLCAEHYDAQLVSKWAVYHQCFAEVAE